MEPITVYVPTHGLPPGSVALLHGCDALGAASLDRPEPSGRGVALAPDDESWSGAGSYHNGPGTLGVAGEETRCLKLRTRGQVFGQRTVGVQIRDRETGELSSACEVTAFVNATPVAPTELTPAAALVGGCVQFALSGGALR